MKDYADFAPGDRIVLEPAGGGEPETWTVAANRRLDGGLKVRTESGHIVLVEWSPRSAGKAKGDWFYIRNGQTRRRRVG